MLLPQSQGQQQTCTISHKMWLCVQGLECMCRPPTSPPKARLGICARDKQGEGGKAGSCAWVERRPWSGLAVLRPAGILSMACETAGKGGCTHRQLCEVPKCVAVGIGQSTAHTPGGWAELGHVFPLWTEPLSAVGFSGCHNPHLLLSMCIPSPQPQQANRFLAHRTSSSSRTLPVTLSHPTVSLPRPSSQPAFQGGLPCSWAPPCCPVKHVGNYLLL